MTIARCVATNVPIRKQAGLEVTKVRRGRPRRNRAAIEGNA